jgi:hypothetical protein
VVKVPIRRRFEDFSSDKEAIRKLKELYKDPNDADLVAGVQLDEEVFPRYDRAKLALIMSLFSLFGMGSSDRFSIGFAMTRCFLVDKPWDESPLATCDREHKHSMPSEESSVPLSSYRQSHLVRTERNKMVLHLHCFCLRTTNLRGTHKAEWMGGS